ncbi:MAG: hypothetical protein AB7O43_05820 [Hyphomicrobiaceae bacterium]
MRLLLICAALAALGYVTAVVIVNRLAEPDNGPLGVVNRSDSLPVAERSLEVLSWNLGYAGLGAESEFVADGGNRVLSPSAAIVDKNLSGIKLVLAGHKTTDVLLLQEVAVTSPLNYWRAVMDAITSLRRGAGHAFLADVATRLLPWPVRLEHGLATYSNVRIGQAESVALPLESSHWLGLLRKQYALLVTRMPVEGDTRQWVIVNMHLAAFDDGGATRRKQLAKAIAFATREYQNGNWVVVGGDWNMVLGGRSFPHKTEAAFTAWVHAMPEGTVPEGWQMVIDPERPTVRTLQKPYVAGENYVTIIDGFLVSPNVSAEAVRTIDLGFAYSDHHPVVARFKAK